ncbi:hypothetical protein [Chamaesiphon sp. VAR_69_metabat_338]|nr:hypothetical protein [Chamaesiphon sp. VAR_69_metabat_338]
MQLNSTACDVINPALTKDGVAIESHRSILNVRSAIAAIDRKSNPK